MSPRNISTHMGDLYRNARRIIFQNVSAAICCDVQFNPPGCQPTAALCDLARKHV